MRAYICFETNLPHLIFIFVCLFYFGGPQKPQNKLYYGATAGAQDWGSIVQYSMEWYGMVYSVVPKWVSWCSGSCNYKAHIYRLHTR